jgi:hypothetical protein
MAMAARLARKLDSPIEPYLPAPSPTRAIVERTREPTIGACDQLGVQTASGKRTQFTPELRSGVDLGTPTECGASRMSGV